jgi:hypothetical protein
MASSKSKHGDFSVRPFKIQVTPPKPRKFEALANEKGLSKNDRLVIKKFVLSVQQTPSARESKLTVRNSSSGQITSKEAGKARDSRVPGERGQRLGGRAAARKK